jgi:hypothetical protein
MYANNEFLSALANKLIEISENCIDIDTQSELNELIEKTTDQIQVQSK